MVLRENLLRPRRDESADADLAHFVSADGAFVALELT
jgi:hypothetical protein